MKLKQLGNGGAFDFDSVNSSFLIDVGDKKFPEYLLFDCGYSVYGELRRQHKKEQIDLKYLTKVYISHMDDDHMGSLKTLIYYMYFVYNQPLEIIAYNEVYQELKHYLSDIDGFVRCGRKIKASLFYLTELQGSGSELKISKDIWIYPSMTYHFKPCYGLKFYKNNESALYISGDTKAHADIKDIMPNFKYVYHDFSNWNSPDDQVHACESDVNRLYSSLNSEENINWYHNNEKFDSGWKEL